MDTSVFIVMMLILLMLGIYGYRLIRAEKDDDNAFDAGLAIIDFARAFPNEAIRSLHITHDGGAVFVKLHDNKSGFMRNMGNHHACIILDASKITLEPLPLENGFHIAFQDWPKYDGKYRFETQEEAADVALWLLESLTLAAASADENDVTDTEELAQGELHEVIVIDQTETVDDEKSEDQLSSPSGKSSTVS